MSRPNRGDEERVPPSNHLWVGNLKPETTDSDLIPLFGRYGVLDSVTTYSSRSFAFIYFKRLDDAKAAKEALQGTSLHGSSLKIEFARPAKPCKQLWVGGISSSVLREELEAEFLKFGKMEEFKFLRDRGTAYIEYVQLEDASQAIKNMNGKQIGGEQIRVDFLRSQNSRREPVSHDMRDGSYNNKNSGFSDAHLAYKRPHPQSLVGRKDDGQPSKVLWVGYPPTLQIDEQMLHNAMILFGEIERIKSFPSRNYSFVEFRSTDEARRAKEGLQGRLFNDPRITIMYSNSELAPGKDYPGSYPGHNHSNLPSGKMQTGGAIGQSMPMRSLGAQGSFDPLHPGQEFKEFNGVQDTNPMPPESNWRRPSPSPGLCGPAPGIRQPMRPGSGSWDLYDANHLQRDPKRSRLDNPLSMDNATFPPRKIDESGLGLEQSYGVSPVTGRGVLSALPQVEGRNYLSPVGARVSAAGPGPGHVDSDCIWRGLIAKGGTPVCHARCVPIGKGIGTELPEVVNCSARTGLDMLTKHYADSIGFDIVFFLPDSEDDFASYTEFLRYLGSKDRAGVAKFDDGTTLFLVPPSDFLTRVLKVVGPERLYGVVLKMPQQSMPSTQIVDRQMIPPTIPPPHLDYSLTHPKDEQPLSVNHGAILREDSHVPAKQHYLYAVDSFPQQPSTMQHVSNNTATVSQAGAALTPELIASLASFLPLATQSSGAEGAPSALGSSTIRQQFPQPSTPSMASHGIYNNTMSESTGYSNEHLGNPVNHMPQSQVHYYSSFGNTSNQSGQVMQGNPHFPESAVGLLNQPLTNFSVPPQSAQVAALSSLGTHQYQYDVPHNNHNRVGMVNGTNNSSVYAAQASPQPGNSAAMSVNYAQQPNLMPFPVQTNNEHQNQAQQHQAQLSGTGQGTSEDEVDKNQRYQSTLQFAANLLLQIQTRQQQQQANPPGGQGTGNSL